jgi:hypothetical protein
LQVTEAAALSVGVKVSAAPVHEVTDIERVIAAVANEGNGGLNQRAGHLRYCPSRRDHRIDGALSINIDISRPVAD